jgi:hypothetical protein
MLIAVIASFTALVAPQVSAGQALLDESAAKLKSTQSITVTVSISSMGQAMKMPTKIMRGGFLRVVMFGMTEQIATPTGGWMLMTAQKQYLKRSTEVASATDNALPGFEPLYSIAKPLVAIGAPAAGKIGDKVTTRIPVDNVQLGGGKGYLHLDPQSRLPAGYETDSDGIKATNGTKLVIGYDDLKVDAGLTAKDFEWTPPPGWTEFARPAQTDFTANLLKLGSKAPSFSLKTPRGGKMSLAKAMEGRKATLVNFWFYG